MRPPGRPRAALPVAAAVLAALALWLLWPDDSVSAHANLLRSAPAAGASLSASPARVVVWFTEPVEPAFSEVRVLGPTGERVDIGGTQVDLTEPTALWVALSPLTTGTYTVAYRVVSTVDGHGTRSSFFFAVGGAVSTPEASPGGPLLQSGFDPGQRWVFFLGAATLVGGLLFEMAVTSPALGAAPADSPAGRAAQKLSDRLGWLLVVAFVAVAIGSLGQIVQQGAVSHGVGFWEGARYMVRVAGGTTWGGQWYWRTALFALAGVAVVLAWRARRPRAEGDAPGLLTESVYGQVALALGLGGLAMTTLMSHAAASPPDVRGAAVASDFLHLLAAAAWAGGLIYLAVSLPTLLRTVAGEERRQALVALVPRFSTVAFLSAGALAVTGVFSGWMQVTAPSAVNTPYGWTLVAKTALFLPLLGLAVANSYIVRPRLGSADSAAGWLRRIVTAEAVLVALALLAVGWLASLEPARQYASRTGIGVKRAEEFRTEAEGARVVARVAPLELGFNEVNVTLTDLHGESITNATDVRARLVYREQDIGAEWLSGISHGGGEWIIHGLPVNLAGNWQAELVVVRPDAFDARVAFPFTVGLAATAADRIRPTERTTSFLLGLEVALLGCVALAAAAPLRRAARRTALVLAGPGLVAVVAGAALSIVVLANGPGASASQTNPVLPTAASVESGRVSYATVCAQCHGVSGRGDGPAGQALARKPSDLMVHVPLHADSALFRFIRDGIPSRGMPAQKGVLSERELWDLVNYLRALAEGGLDATHRVSSGPGHLAEGG